MGKVKGENTKWRLTCHKELVLELDEKCWEMRIKTRHELVDRIIRLSLRLLEPGPDNEPTQFERLEASFARQDVEEAEEKNTGLI